MENNTAALILPQRVPHKVTYYVQHLCSTYVKISQLVTSLQTSCQQDVFALLVPSCQQVVPNLLTTCNRLDENIGLVTICQQLVPNLFQLVTICQQLVPNLFQQIRKKQCEYILSTTCEQICYNLFAGL